MDQRIAIPQEWQVPLAIRARIAEVPGTQRCLEAEGHILLVLHKLPAPDDTHRYLRLFWRHPDGDWASSDLGPGIKALQKHIAEYTHEIEQLEQLENSAANADEYFHIRHEITPICRAAQNLAAAVARAYEMTPDDRGLLACRNLGATVQRTAELLKEDATYSLDYFMAKQAESQALASHRLNLIAAIFFPILAFASIFGMNLTHGFEGKSPWLFWLFMVIGISIGAIMTSLVVKPNNKHKARKRHDYS